MRADLVSQCGFMYCTVLCCTSIACHVLYKKSADLDTKLASVGGWHKVTASPALELVQRYTFHHGYLCTSSQLSVTCHCSCSIRLQSVHYSSDDNCV